jgi:hypothetical protein
VPDCAARSRERMQWRLCQTPNVQHAGQTLHITSLLAASMSTAYVCVRSVRTPRNAKCKRGKRPIAPLTGMMEMTSGASVTYSEML